PLLWTSSLSLPLTPPSLNDTRRSRSRHRRRIGLGAGRRSGEPSSSPGVASAHTRTQCEGSPCDEPWSCVDTRIRERSTVAASASSQPHAPPSCLPRPAAARGTAQKNASGGLQKRTSEGEER